MFEVSAHRATTALEKLNSRCNALTDEAMQVCVHRETIHTAQMGQVQLGAKRQHMHALVKNSSFQLSRVSAFTFSEGWRCLELFISLASRKTLANKPSPESESICGPRADYWSRSVVSSTSSQCCAAAREK